MLSANEFTDTASDVVINLGAVATALAAIAGVVFGSSRWLLKRIERMVTEATEPLRKNGGGNVGDLPKKFDDMSRRIELIEQRQQVIKAAVIELGHYDSPRSRKGPLPGESPP